MKIIKLASLSEIDFGLDLQKKYNPKKHGITQSMLSNIGCPVKMGLSLNRFRNPESEYKFIFGDMNHWVTERLYK